MVVVVVARSGAARRGDGRRRLETWNSSWEIGAVRGQGLCQCQCQRQCQRQSHCCYPGVGVVGVFPGRDGRGVERSMSGVLLGAPLLQGVLKPLEQQR